MSDLSNWKSVVTFYQKLKENGWIDPDEAIALRSRITVLEGELSEVAELLQDEGISTVSDEPCGESIAEGVERLIKQIKPKEALYCSICGTSTPLGHLCPNCKGILDRGVVASDRDRSESKKNSRTSSSGTSYVIDTGEVIP